jgi:hypothetical protein
MVTRAVSHHAASQLAGLKLSNGIERPSKLESAPLLQILTFKKELLPGPFIKRLTSQDGGPMRMARNVSSSSFHIR